MTGRFSCSEAVGVNKNHPSMSQFGTKMISDLLTDEYSNFMYILINVHKNRLSNENTIVIIFLQAVFQEFNENLRH